MSALLVLSFTNMKLSSSQHCPSFPLGCLQMIQLFPGKEVSSSPGVPHVLIIVCLFPVTLQHRESQGQSEVMTHAPYNTF